MEPALTRCFRAPGRANIIGEHTDYNDGFALPFAVERQTFVRATAEDGGKVRARSDRFADAVSIDLSAPWSGRRGGWSDYVEGVVRALQASGVPVAGCDLEVTSDIPVGVGMSSSAALEIALGMALAAVAGASLSSLELARAGQRAENAYVGVRSGMLDQLAIVGARAGHAALLDCRSFAMRQIPFAADAAFLICDSGVRRSLASSAYNERREDCAQGVALLRSFGSKADALRDVDLASFERVAPRLPERIGRRCRHVITENARTLAAADACSAGDLSTLGLLMDASHASLRDDYEVSCPELDALVDIARGIDGVYGARMMGAGFGGAAIVLAAGPAAAMFAQCAALPYRQRTGRELRVYPTGLAQGACEIGPDGEALG